MQSTFIDIVRSSDSKLHAMWFPLNLNISNCILFIACRKANKPAQWYHEEVTGLPSDSIVINAIPVRLDYKESEIGRETYCKRGYFRWGKISRKCCEDLSRGGNLAMLLIKSYGFYFRVGEFSRRETISRKNAKITPMRTISRLL